MSTFVSDNNDNKLEGINHDKLENAYEENGIIYDNSNIDHNIKHLPLDTWELSNKKILNIYNNSAFL